MESLFGRDPELALVRSFLRAADGQGGTLLLSGERGAGKTALLRAAARCATDMTVLQAQGVPVEADLSFSGLHQVLLPLVAGVAGLRPVHCAALSAALGLVDGPAVECRVVGEAALALLRRGAVARPMLILIDDLQWIDRFSAGVLSYVAHHLAGARIGVLAAVRPGSNGGFVGTGLRVHELEPLGEDAAADLLDARFPALAAPHRRRVMAEGRGNPMALLELGAVEERTRRRPQAVCGPDADAEVLHRAAVESLRLGDSVGAVTTLLRAADLTPRGPARGRRLAHAAYVGADVTGELLAVPRLLARARAADPDVDRSLAAAVATAHLLLNSDGDIDTSHRLLVDAIEAAGDAPGVDDALVEALHTLLMVCSFGCRPELWPPFRRAVARLGPRVPVTLSLCTWSLADAARTPVRAVEQVVTVVDGLHDEVDPLRIVRIATAAFYLERLEGCRDALWRVVRDGRHGGAVASAISALLILAFDAYHAGRWDEAGRLAAEALTLCDTHGYQLLSSPGQLCLALLAAARGDDETVRTRTDELTGWGVPRGARRVVIYAHEARALAALGRGDFEDAYEAAAAACPPGTLEPDNGHALWLTLTLVEAAARTHRTQEAAAHVAALQEVGTAALAPRLALLAGGAAAIAAPDDRAGGLFAAALALPDVERWPFDLARVRLAYGEHLRRARMTTAAREQLTAALAAFRSLGARPWVARAEGELRAASHHHLRRRHDGGEAALTAQEREVADLAASGMTNQQIADRLRLSRRTVDAHLYRAFPKLGITSRAALRDALGRLSGSWAGG